MSKIIIELKETSKIEEESMNKAFELSDWENYYISKGWFEALEYAIRIIENPLYTEDK
tara:strand:+ start:471 stop:644 length:174 start_codon:yes stop_codon:yes gene_type:complete